MFTKFSIDKLNLIPVKEILRNYSSKANIKYQLISKIDFPRILKHVEKNAFKEEPLLKAADVNRSTEGNQFFKHLTMNALRKKLSVVALGKNNEIAGVAINNIARPGDIARELQSFNVFRDIKLKKLLYLIYSLNHIADVFRSFDVNKILEIRLLSISPDYAETDVTRSLINKSELVAKLNGIQLIKAETANLIYQNVLKSSRFRTALEIFFEDYKDNKGEPAMNVELPHKKYQILYRML